MIAHKILPFRWQRPSGGPQRARRIDGAKNGALKIRERVLTNAALTPVPECGEKRELTERRRSLDTGESGGLGATEALKGFQRGVTAESCVWSEG